MDHVTPNLWTVSISYGYWMLNGREINVLNVLTAVLFPILMWSIFSNLRINLLYLPWNIYTMGLYRFARYSCILLVVAFQVTGQARGLSSVTYFVTSLGLQNGLLSLVHFEGYLGQKNKYKQAKAEEREAMLMDEDDDGLKLLSVSSK